MKLVAAALMFVQIVCAAEPPPVKRVIEGAGVAADARGTAAGDLGIGDPSAALPRAGYRWTAVAQIGLAGAPATVERKGFVPGVQADREECALLAEVQFLDEIRGRFGAGIRLVPGSFKFLEFQYFSPEQQNEFNVSADVSIRVGCQSWERFEYAAGPLGDVVTIRDYLFRAITKVEGQTQTAETWVRAQNAPKDLILWSGPVPLGAKGVTLEVRFEQFRERVEIDTNFNWTGKGVWDAETVTLGEARIDLRNERGRLVADFHPGSDMVLRSARNLKGGKTASVQLKGGGRRYYGGLHIKSNEEYAAHLKEIEEENQRRKPLPGEQVEVLHGLVRQEQVPDAAWLARARREEELAKAENTPFVPLPPTITGVGALCVLARDLRAAEAYVARVCPTRKDVIVAKDRDDASMALMRRWTALTQDGKPRDFVEGTLTISFTPDKGVENGRFLIP